MANESPAAVIVDGVNGVEVAVVDGVAVPVNTRALLISGRDAGGVARHLRVDTDGSITADVERPASATVAAVAQSELTVTLLAANTARKGAIIYNNAALPLKVRFGAGASASDFSLELPARAVYELPFPTYTGQITGAWAGAGEGTAQVTETT